jgi:DNA-binding MarR family transcriptional regulator
MLDLYSHVMMARPVTQDLNARQLRLLVLASETTAGVTIRGAAEKMSVPKPSITRSGDRLELLGLAERQDDPADKRSVLIKITAAGRKLLKDINADIARGQKAVAKRLATEAARREKIMGSASDAALAA